MRTRRSLTLLLLAGICLAVCAAAGAATHETLTLTSRQQAVDREHPGSHLLPLVVTRPFRGGARVCGYYENDTYNQPEDGRVKLVVSLWRDGVRIGRFAFKRRTVRFNQLDLGCKSTPRLRRGDTLLFDFRFFEMPRLAPRIFSHGGLVETYMLVRATVEPPLPEPPSTIEFRDVEPAFGSRVPPGGKIKVGIAYTCNQPQGCNVVADFESGLPREDVRWVAPGSGVRKLTLRCPTESRYELIQGGLVLEIERAAYGTLDAMAVAGEFTCLPDEL